MDYLNYQVDSTLIYLITLVPLGITFAIYGLGAIYISKNKIGIVEKLWLKKSFLIDEDLIVLNKEKNNQEHILFSGIHFFYWSWQYKVHQRSLGSIPSGKISLLYSPNSPSLETTQNTDNEIESNNSNIIEDISTISSSEKIGFTKKRNQILILKEGIFAFNLALLIIITNEYVYCLKIGKKNKSGINSISKTNNLKKTKIDNLNEKQKLQNNSLEIENSFLHSNI